MITKTNDFKLSPQCTNSQAEGVKIGLDDSLGRDTSVSECLRSPAVPSSTRGDLFIFTSFVLTKIKIDTIRPLVNQITSWKCQNGLKESIGTCYKCVDAWGVDICAGKEHYQLF